MFNQSVEIVKKGASNRKSVLEKITTTHPQLCQGNDTPWCREDVYEDVLGDVEEDLESTISSDAGTLTVRTLPPPAWDEVPSTPPATTLLPTDITELENEVVEGAKMNLSQVSHRENLLVTTYVMNHYIDVYFARLSEFLDEPVDFFRRLFSVRSQPGKLKLFSMLSMFFRNDGNISASTRFLEYGAAIAKNLYDDYGTDSSYFSGVAFYLLSHAYSPVDVKKARFYARLSSSLLEEATHNEAKLNVMKMVILNINQVNFGKRSPSEASLLVDSMQALARSARITSADSPPELPTTYGSAPLAAQLKLANPELSVQFQGVPLFVEVLKRRHPLLFAGALGPALLVKASMIDTFMFIREIALIFLPDLANAAEELTERQAAVPRGSIPEEIGHFMLVTMAQLEHEIFQLTGCFHLKELDLFYVSSIIHRAMGNHQAAIEHARHSIQFIFKTVSNGAMSPVFRVVIPLFMDACCLIENGLVSEADMVLPYISRFSNQYPNARLACETLQILKDKARQEAPKIPVSLSRSAVHYAAPMEIKFPSSAPSYMPPPPLPMSPEPLDFMRACFPPSFTYSNQGPPSTSSFSSSSSSSSSFTGTPMTSPNPPSPSPESMSPRPFSVDSPGFLAVIDSLYPADPSESSSYLSPFSPSQFVVGDKEHS